MVCIFCVGGLHLPLTWFASSAQVVCISRSGGLHLPLSGPLPPKIPILTPAPDHPLGGHRGDLGDTSGREICQPSVLYTEGDVLRSSKIIWRKLAKLLVEGWPDFSRHLLGLIKAFLRTYQHWVGCFLWKSVGIVCRDSAGILFSKALVVFAFSLGFTCFLLRTFVSLSLYNIEE